MDRGHTTIKAVVIGLGFVIVGLVVVLVWGSSNKVGKVSTPATTASADKLADVAVALPAGGHIAAMTGDGDRLSLLVDLPGGAQTIMTVDRATGEVLGTLELVPRSESGNDHGQGSFRQ